PYPPWSPAHVLLPRRRVSEAPAIAVVRDPRIDTEHERGLAPKLVGQVNVDWGQAGAVNGDRCVIDQDHRLVEDSFHDEMDAPIRPVRRDLDTAAIASGPLSVAQRRKLDLPDAGCADRMALAIEPRRRSFEYEIPEAIEREGRATTYGVNIHFMAPQCLVSDPTWAGIIKLSEKLIQKLGG